ncbi:MAG: YggS family pyridoxal phosphate-dependent enzyme [Sinobacterium sp.]|nr:YggS family pyridoxal phosphate-dependent enzyme [Sinobacterium sp.]
MPALEHNIESLKLRISRACKRANRDENSVFLLPVTKTRNIKALEAAHSLGFTQFGENYLSEAKEKIAHFKNKSIQWHFIGPIQSNKTRYIAEHFDWVQTVDREKILKRLSDQRPNTLPPLNFLVQVNVSCDENKSGVSIEEARTLANLSLMYPNLCFRGLMALPTAYDNEQKTIDDFQKMQQLYISLQQKYSQCDTLSMGMSGDLEHAIGQGSTMIRIGSDFFGPRE